MKTGLEKWIFNIWLKTFDKRRHVLAVRRESRRPWIAVVESWLLYCCFLGTSTKAIELHGNREPSCWQTTITIYYYIVSNRFCIIYQGRIVNIVTSIHTDVYNSRYYIPRFIYCVWCLYILCGWIILYLTYWASHYTL